MTIPLIDKDDVISRGGKQEKVNYRDDRSRYRDDKVFNKKEKKEKPIRIIRIKYYEKISLPHMKDRKIGYIDAFAVDRSLEDLMKALYYNANIQGIINPPDCIFVEKDNRMGNNNKFIFIEISKNEFGTLKKEMENYRTIQGFNKGEFIIMEGGRRSLAETLDMPMMKKNNDVLEDKGVGKISDTNTILMRQKLRDELKDIFSPYHSYTDEEIDNMKENELIALKKLSNMKMKLENKKRKKTRKLFR